MRRLVILILGAMLLASCGGDSTATTLASSTSQDTATPPESSTSSDAETTTTAGEVAEGEFAITEIDFAAGELTITNVGDNAASLEGYRLCQRPTYSPVTDDTLEPGESVTLDASVVGGFDPTSGELGLYKSALFDNPDDIVSYVEWGRAGHGRSATAVDAGIWPADAFVETSADTQTLTTDVGNATSPDEWVVG